MSSPFIWGATGPLSLQPGPVTIKGTTSGSIAIAPQAASGTFNFNLPTTAGLSGQVLTSGGGVGSPMTWSSAPVAPNVTSQTSTYTAGYNDLVIASGTSFSITLPTAVGATGSTISVKHAGSNFTQAYTLLTTSGQTINGIASGAYALYTFGEYITVISDGTNWQVIDRISDTAWVAYTPVWAASVSNPTVGTGGSLVGYWRRYGSDIICYITITIGTGNSVGSGTYTLSLPASALIDTNVVAPNQNNLLESVANMFDNSTAINYPLWPGYNSTSTVFLKGLNTGNPDARMSSPWSNVYPDAVATSDVIYIKFRVPIAGLQP